MGEPLKITLQAWRVFALLEKTDDPLVGRSLAFISDNLRTYTPAVLEEAIGELFQADLIESIPGMNRYRLNRALTIRESFLPGSEPDTKSEPLYTAYQPIWFRTGGKKHPAVFIKYIGMTVQIRTHGSMHPQNVDLSTIAPREETPQ